MLIRFEVENFRSIAREAELSMVAVDRDRDATVAMEPLGQSLLKVAGIYGPNASGKSNVLAALNWLCDGIATSLRFWDESIPFDPFAFGAGPGKPSRFVLELSVDGVRFEYSLEVDSEKVVSEALFHFPKKLRRRIFERSGGSLLFQRGLGRLSGTKELLTDRTLVMSVAPRFDEPLVTAFAQQVRQIQTLGPSGFFPRRSAYGRHRVFLPSRVRTERWFDDEIERHTDERGRALSLLKLADLGIDDVMIDEDEVQSADSPESRVQKSLKLVHRVSTTSEPLGYEQESAGTRTWFRLIGPTLQALRQGSLVVVDELDASLHPTLAAELVHLFHRPDTNPLCAQLVFTSHDTSLLNHLNRDEVWLTEKGDDGVTVLGSLAEFAGERVRKHVSIESGYLHGRFGALPQVDRIGFLRSLGLIG